MVTIQPLELTEAEYAMDQGEFSIKLTSSQESVVIILTQGWCPQWAALKRQISRLKLPNLTVFAFIYDRSPIFTEFMRFKEQTFHNFEVPYVRYYKHGKLVDTSNAVGKQRFVKNLKL